MPTLFDSLRVGDLVLPNRIIMAPLTRARSGETRVPNDLMAEYYRQRASAGLILSEAINVSAQGIGYADTPGIWNDEQIAGWKKITTVVHDAGGLIFAQLWHAGRVSHPVFLNGELPVAPSAVTPAGNVRLVRPPTPHVAPRALLLDEIPGIVESFRQGAKNAKIAGFDGVEIHGANGYLLDQFLQDKTNKRTDEYGGSVENRARLLLEVTDAAILVWGAGRVGVHLAPRGDSQDIGDSNPPVTFGYVARELGKRKIAFIFVRESIGENSIAHALRKAFGGVFIANEKFTKDTAEQAIAAGDADAVAFGMPFIANPDLPARFAKNAPLNELHQETFYGAGAHGYTDYPAMKQ